MQECRALYVCVDSERFEAYRRKKADPDVQAKAEWHKAWEKVGVVDVGDYVMSMTITDGAETWTPSAGSSMPSAIGRNYFGLRIGLRKRSDYAH